MGFQTPQYRIGTLLEAIGKGDIQLPDFQREYRWEDERIRQLLVTILRGHPMGVVMLLQTGNDQVRFKPKPLTGAEGVTRAPKWLLLDGQQRLTSMFQALTGSGVVHTADDRGKKLTRRYFLNVELAIGDSGDQEDAVLSLPVDGIVRENFGRDVVLDVSTHDRQIAAGLMPVTVLFDRSATGWLFDYFGWGSEAEQQHRREVSKTFNDRVLQQVGAYEIPAIELDDATSRDAVATVFEKVNTGGLPLDTFELLTATFAGDPDYLDKYGEAFRLGEDWKQTQLVLAKHPALANVSRIFFLQAVSLLASRERRLADIAVGKAKPAPLSAKRDDILRLELSEYLTWAPRVRDALPWVAHFYTSQHIHSAGFVPYHTQAVPLVAIRVLLGEQADSYAIKERIAQWYWCGVLGELYGSTTESRFARDVDQVPGWARAAVTGEPAPTPETVQAAVFVESRLLSLRTRLSAAYKGIYALMMRRNVRDWQYDQPIDHANYFEQQIDIHHIFPRAWCDKVGIDPDQRESIVNKTPLAKKTNIMLSGDSPAEYLPRLAARTALEPDQIDELLRAHLIDPAALRAADFRAFFEARRATLLAMIEDAMGKTALRDLSPVDGAPAPIEAPEMFERVPDDPADEEEAP